MNVRVTAETDLAITLGWDLVAKAAGFVYAIDGDEHLADGKRHFTMDGTRTSVKLAKPQDGKPHTYTVEALGIVDTGSVTSPQQPSSSAPEWVGTFADGMPASSVFPLQSYVADHAQVVADPLGSGRNVLRLAVDDSDRPYTGATNPRADFESPGMFKPGDEAWIRVVPLIPKAVPPVTGWFQFAEVYGPPHGGSPPLGLSIIAVNGVNHFAAFRGARYSYDRIWLGPEVDGAWHEIILHERFATDSTGFVEIYFDGAQQTLANGQTRAAMVTLDPGVNWDGSTPNFLNVNQYRKAGMFAGTVTIYHGSPAVGSSRDSVAGLATP